MLWFLYNVLFSIGFLLALPYYLMRMRRRGGYARNFWQRVGRYDEQTRTALGSGGSVWVHAVSVGELFVALKLIERLRQRNPGLRFMVSVTTSTAHALAREQLTPEDVLVYFPVDFPFVMGRILRLARPRAILVMEGEIWPNWIRLAHRNGIPMAVINARLSLKSYRGYRKVRAFFTPVLGTLKLVCAQTESDANRLRDLGVAEEALHVTGSAKYDVARVENRGGEQARAVLESFGVQEGELVLLGGSTWPGEEAALARAYRSLREQDLPVRLVLVPRHVERTPAIVPELEALGFKVVLRTELDPTTGSRERGPDDILLVNTTGELTSFYACADIIFVGKSLTEHGGQNLIEPAVYGKPVVVGPNMENFPVVTQDFLSAGAIRQVADEPALLEALQACAGDPALREDLGRRAAGVVQQRRGALAATEKLLFDRGILNDPV